MDTNGITAEITAPQPDGQPTGTDLCARLAARNEALGTSLLALGKITVVELERARRAQVDTERPLADVIRYNAQRGLCGPGLADDHVQKRLEHVRAGTAHRYERTRPDGTVIEMQGKRLPGGGYVTSFADITDHKRVQREL